jgi:hypothetical protein
MSRGTPWIVVGTVLMAIAAPAMIAGTVLLVLFGPDHQPRVGPQVASTPGRTLVSSVATIDDASELTSVVGDKTDVEVDPSRLSTDRRPAPATIGATKAQVFWVAEARTADQASRPAVAGHRP